MPVGARQQNVSLVTTVNSRILNLGSMTNSFGGQIIDPEGVALIGPAGTTNPALGTRYPYKMTSLDVIDIVWPQESSTLSPSAAEWLGRWWALLDQNTIVLAPTPDAPLGAVYTAEVTGLFQPTPISAANPTTYISTYYPDLFECAIMVFMSGWLQRNYGAQSDDPRQAQSWETQYQTLLPACVQEEDRRRGAGVGWTANRATQAQPARA